MQFEEYGGITLNETFNEIEKRVFLLKTQYRFVVDVDYVRIIQSLNENVFAYDTSNALSKVQHLVVSLKELEDDWNRKDRFDEFPSFDIKEVQYYLTELKKIKAFLVGSMGVSTKKGDLDVPEKTERGKIKTNLSVDQLAVLFKILNEYDDNSPPNVKILKDYDVKRNLFRDIAATFSSRRADAISPKSIDSAYGDNYQDATVDFWIEKFASLSKSARRMRHEMINKKDITKRKIK